jgi:ribonuclease HI
LESIPPQLRGADHLNFYPNELPILRFWSPSSSPQTPSPPTPTHKSPTSWFPPPKDFIKLNFDGASKGNPGPAGYGIVFRDHHGNILLIRAGYIGHSTNNVAELWGLTEGIQMAIKHNFSKLIVEGDSQIIINLLWKILNGANPDRISPSWRLLHGLQRITDSLCPNLDIIPAHVRRSENQVADELANIGINRGETELICISALEPSHPILQQCIGKA